MRKQSRWAAFMAILALSIGSLALAGPSNAETSVSSFNSLGQYTGLATITPVKAQTVTTFPMCRVAYTTSPHATLRYYSIQQHTRYQFGYTAAGDPVHRIYWNYTKIVNSDGSLAYVGSELSRFQIYIGGVYSSAYSSKIIEANRWSSVYTDAPYSAWFHDYKQIKVQQIGAVYHRDIVVAAANRIPYLNASYGRCSESTYSPYN